MVQTQQFVLIALLIVALLKPAGGESPRFFADDPIRAMPAPLPVEKPHKQDINDALDFLSNSWRWAPPRPRPAGAVNTLGEVPDSEWFINRHAHRRLSRAELQSGPGPFEAPAPPFTVTGGKEEGIMAGFRMKDSKGRSYFVKVDPLKYPELASASDVIVSKFLYAIGYNTPRNELVYLMLPELRVSDTAKITIAGERPRRMTRKDLEQIIQHMPHYEDGSVRILASLAIEGDSIGPFQYEGTRYDDPNDIVPHEDRRDLRGLNVIYGWFNNTDAKASNTLDVVVAENGVRFIRHYLLDFGSALGSDGDAPKDPRLGHEFMLSTPGAVLTRIVNLGLLPARWERAHFPDLPEIGNFESNVFDPAAWKSDYPNPAFMSRLPDDDYWAAKQVMAFTDDDIRAIVETAMYSDARSTQCRITTLAERRDKIGKTYFSMILPLDFFRVENGELLFDDLAVRYGFHPPRSYEARWSKFDNMQQTHQPISDSGSTHLPREAMQALPGSYFCAVIRAVGDPLKPVIVYIRKEENGYKVVGVDRTW